MIFEAAARSGIIGNAADMPFRSHRICDSGRNLTASSFASSVMARIQVSREVASEF
jgi:hypothetical protein